MFQFSKITKGIGDRFTLPHVLDDYLMWRDRAGVKSKLHSALVASHLCWLLGALFN
jgi:hypothetical protein